MARTSRIKHLTSSAKYDEWTMSFYRQGILHIIIVLILTWTEFSIADQDVLINRKAQYMHTVKITQQCARRCMPCITISCHCALHATIHQCDIEIFQGKIHQQRSSKMECNHQQLHGSVRIKPGKTCQAREDHRSITIHENNTRGASFGIRDQSFRVGLNGDTRSKSWCLPSNNTWRVSYCTPTEC